MKLEFLLQILYFLECFLILNNFSFYHLQQKNNLYLHVRTSHWSCGEKSVIIVAISAITGLLFTDIDFINALRFWKFLFLFFSTVMGLIGFVVALLIFLTKLCSIEVLGIPYTDYLNMSIKPKNKDKYRYLSNNKLRLDDSNED